MLRVTVVESSSEWVKLRVEGRVAGCWVEELRRSCEIQALNAAIPLILDLADVSFVDPAGIKLFMELKARCVTLLSPSPFVSEQLKAVPSCDDIERLANPFGQGN